MSKALIYVIEDDPIFTRLFKEILDRNNFTNVSFFASGEEGLEAMRKKPDAIFLDFSLSGLNGLDILERIRKKYSKVKVYILTSINDPMVKQKCLEAGADAYIEKTKEGLERLEGQILSQINARVFSLFS